MRVLVVNAGSATLKLSLLEDDKLLDSRHVETSDPESGRKALAEALEAMDRPDAVGHRVVHGGPAYTRAVRIDPRVRARLGEYTSLAPLHQPAALAGIDLVSEQLPDVPAVACFDTAFHSTLPPAASTYALPARWREEYGLRRYGFHGLSAAYAARRAAELVDRPVQELRTVVCHLGAGASATAVRAGRSVDTTMGFTPLAGLVMASRPGDVDPGLLVWLLRNGVVDTEGLDAALEHDSGLTGLAGTPDMRQVVERAQAGDAQASLAIGVYVHRLRGLVAAMTASLGDLDVLVFTGGVGEHAPLVRSRTVEGLAFLGLALDDEANSRAEGDTDLTAPSARARTLVIEAREDLQIAAEVRRLCQ
ncbi:acetate kinase [Actinopolymorpha cephalotaxi]|uniref:Acetate kinase n=1 Tax=Actinopolymorpha cephalotaxi TaxID=504797 RepID=A0A1I2VNJ5_9ACTN|nr:acetate/propionate family kinase [Actinopolymorpha cephalotaxi]NYH83236.1 acetate kinase [Actinopolymorpha cephalotaxi]SFG90895.1 acetate kinase [Actinopolymorpha cephalotaxi]